LKKQDITKTHGIGSPKRKNKELLTKRLLDVKEAGEYLGRSEGSIRELIWAGRLPAIKVGRRIHLDIGDLDEWIEQHRIRYTF
jgi:excisionase family DNA binding protein